MHITTRFTFIVYCFSIIAAVCCIHSHLPQFERVWKYLACITVLIGMYLSKIEVLFCALVLYIQFSYTVNFPFQDWWEFQKLRNMYEHSWWKDHFNIFNIEILPFMLSRVVVIKLNRWGKLLCYELNKYIPQKPRFTFLCIFKWKKCIRKLLWMLIV